MFSGNPLAGNLAGGAGAFVATGGSGGLGELWMMQELEVAAHLISLEELEAFGLQELEVLGLRVGPNEKTHVPRVLPLFLGRRDG